MTVVKNTSYLCMPTFARIVNNQPPTIFVQIAKTFHPSTSPANAPDFLAISSMITNTIPSVHSLILLPKSCTIFSQHYHQTPLLFLSLLSQNTFAPAGLIILTLSPNISPNSITVNSNIFSCALKIPSRSVLTVPIVSGKPIMPTPSIPKPLSTKTPHISY